MQSIKYHSVIEFLIIVGILIPSFLVDLQKTEFHPDESMWINQSSHLEDFFAGSFPPAITPREKDLALTMPTIPEYVIGLSRKLGGYGPAQLNTIWDWTKTNEENKTEGNIPTGKLLWWSRLLPCLLSITSIILTFYIIKFSFNVRVGYGWIILTIVNPWLIVALQRAMGEAPLLFNIVAGMLAGFLAIQTFKTDEKSNWMSLFWLTVFGVFTGLAGQTKTNGLAIFPAGIVILIVLTIRCQTHMRWRFFLSGLAALVISTFIFFIGPNPFFWSDPIGKTLETVKYRVNLIQNVQLKAFPQFAVKDWRDGMQIAQNRIFYDLTPLKFENSRYLMMLLAGLGSVMLIFKTWPSITSTTRIINTGALSILIVGFFASVPNLFTPINIDRYYLLPLYFVSILVCIGFDWFLRYAISIKPTSLQRTES